MPVVMMTAVMVGLATNGLAAPPQTVVVDGVPHVRNGAVPTGGKVVLKGKELWRAGGEDDEVVFGSIGRALCGAGGEILLLDSQLSQVQVYSPTGKHLRTLSREGDGPGEVRRPGDMLLLPGGHLGLIQGFPGRIVRVGLDGLPAGDFTVGTGDPTQGRFAVLVQGASRGGTTALVGIQMTFSPTGASNQTFFLATYDDAGKQIRTYLSKDYPINYADFELDEGQMDFIWGRWDIAPDGRIYAATHRNAYEINVYAADGTLERAIDRPYESWMRDANAREVARQTLDAVARNYPAQPRKLTVENTDPDIGAVWAASGEVWVLPSRGTRERPPGCFNTWDVFDAQGVFVRQVALHLPGNPLQDALFLISPDRAVVVTGSLDAFLSQQGVEAKGEAAADAGAMEVICYELSR
jgi:hypothetical protein